MAENAFQELDLLLEQLCEGLLEEEPDAGKRLVQLLEGSESCRRRYLATMELHTALWTTRGCGKRLPDISATSVQTTSPCLDETELSESGSPVLPLLSTTLPGAVGWFSSGWPVAYTIATVICGVSMLIGSVVHVSEPVQVARQSASLPSPFGRGAGGEGRGNADSPLPSVVGRITGMVDCRWEKGSGFGVQGSGAENQKSEIRNQKSLVALGDKFALASGLMEITYDTGAKVILQGPVTYEVESRSGGFLSLGRLTARVEKQVASGQWSGTSKSPNLQVSKSPNSSLSTLHSPLFTIKTPTAIVTDLGTEFGVEVSKEGYTTSHVFRGLVRLQVASADGNTEGVAQSCTRTSRPAWRIAAIMAMATA